jgi:endonuclease YncB( thermonuclease family)
MQFSGKLEVIPNTGAYASQEAKKRFSAACQELVAQGWCRWYRRYAPGETVLEGLEHEACEAKKGLWVDPQSVPQWVLRKARVPTG